MKTEAGGLTRSASFDYISSIDAPLFEVRADIDVNYALSRAACLAESIAAIACNAVQSEMDSSTAYLVEFAAEAIKGLVNSVMGADARKAVQL
jgi:hypothetical protein